MTLGCGAAILGCEGPTLSQAEARFFREADPFGFILFARNVETPRQVRRLTEDLRNAVGRQAPVFVDQEGGRVQRLRAPHWADWSPVLDMVQTGMAGAGGPEAARRAVWLRYRLIAGELLAVGIDANCAPVLDIAGALTHPVLRNRCLAETAGLVAILGRAAAEGHLAGGVLPVIKHMPGQGRATADSHKDLPHVATPRAELEQTDFAPFRALADLPMGMTAHVVFDEIDPDHPATTSPRMIGLIRDHIGFDGLLMTDDLSMQALSGTLGARVTAAFAAGCDVALHCNGDLGEMAEVVSAAGRFAARAQARADRALALRAVHDSIDIAPLQAELERLLNGRAHV